MKWLKKGNLFSPNTSLINMQHYGILPTPEYIESENIIRIYFASTCAKKIGRIFYLDFNANDMALLNTPQLLLSEGQPGNFDDSGVNPSCMVYINGNKHLFYIGYQRSTRVPYLLFAGTASFESLATKNLKLIRHQSTPLLERTNDEPCIRSATTVLFYQNKYLMWYVGASHWEQIKYGLFKDKMMPNYVIKFAISSDGLHYETQPGVAINYENEHEFGFGRPWVIFENNIFKMWYSVRRRDKTYRIGYAESKDAINWIRKDNEVGIDVSENGWDSEMICYPAVISIKSKTYLFYNGNNNGESGFGYAELIND
jgi:hypothetical protein